jgi:hypothetical protein
MLAIQLKPFESLVFKNSTKVVQILIPTVNDTVKLIFDDIDTFVDANGTLHATTLDLPQGFLPGISQTIPLVIPYVRWVKKIYNGNPSGEAYIFIEESDFI